MIRDENEAGAAVANPPAQADRGLLITSKFAGRCRACGGGFAIGDKVYWKRGEGSSHVVCPTDQPRHEVSVGAGVFRKDGKIYVVKPNRDKTRFYAKEIVESPKRINELEEKVDFEAVYRPGVIFELNESDRWPLQEAKHFLTKYARCIVCGRGLKAAKSVEGAIGPVCAKYFANHAEQKAPGDYWVDDAGRARTDEEPDVS